MCILFCCILLSHTFIIIIIIIYQVIKQHVCSLIRSIFCSFIIISIFSQKWRKISIIVRSATHTMPLAVSTAKWRNPWEISSDYIVSVIVFSIGKASQGTSVKGFELSEYRGVLSPLFCAALTVTYDAICILFKCFHLSMLLSD